MKTHDQCGIQNSKGHTAKKYTLQLDYFQAFVTPVVVVKKYLQNSITCNKTAHIPVRSERQAVADFWDQLHDSLLLIKDSAPPQISLFEAFILKECSTYYGLRCT